MARKSAKKRMEPRKKPAQARSAETVAAIVEAAARILEDKGFQGYNTNDVAARAGVSIGSLYQYFPNKDAITKALLSREAEPLSAAFEQIGDAPSLTEGLQRFVRAAVAHQLRRPVLARLLDFEEARLPLQAENGAFGDVGAKALGRLLSRHRAGRGAAARTASLDMFAIAKGMIDAAGERGETDAQALETRVTAAMSGYLQRMKIIDL
jgi:AcrR family transcriptional regulator